MATHKDDISALIRQAQGEVRDDRPRRPPRGGRNGPAAWPRFALGALLVLAGYFAWWSFAPLPAGRVASDLEAVIEAARLSVEKARAETGRLPDSLPNAALAAVVRYERGQSDYRLSTSVLGVRVTLERDGSKIVDRDGD